MSELSFCATRLRLAPVFVVALALACDDGGSGSSGEGAIGMPCTSNLDCSSAICLPSVSGESVCSQGCTDPLGDECPGGWRCRRPDEIDQLVCVCEPTSVFEICSDGEDNDCNGAVDDCLTCGAAVVSPNSTQHCGECDRRCVPGSTCDDGECVCGAADQADCLLEPGDAHCASDADCEDGIDCTRDFCGEDGSCFSRIELGVCGPGESCDPLGGGCTLGEECESFDDCFDDDPCTSNEHCDFNGFCVYEPLDNDVDGALSPMCGGFDCNDNDGSVAPGASEQCDGIDNTCDGMIDEPLSANACGTGSVCILGSCGCDNGFFDCGNSFDSQCADLDSDVDNCGSCGLRCDPGFACVAGNCADVDECAELDCPEHSVCTNLDGGFECRCEAGFVPDATAENCVDFDECEVNADNCHLNAACANTEGSFTCDCHEGYEGDGVTCGDANECEAGDEIACGGHGTCSNLIGTYTCDCDQGYAFDTTDMRCEVEDECAAGLLEDYGFCAGACQDLRTTSAHCGECGHDCNDNSGATATCEAGACACQDGNLTYCSDEDGCVNTDDSELHCGDCDSPCPESAGCIGGECFCPAETHECGDFCVAFGTVDNCLSCGDSCPDFATCEAGGCTCPAGAPTECGGECVNTTNDERYCGDCETQCPTSATCTASNCVCPGATPDVCGGACVDNDSDEDYCGNCETSCSVVCNEGSCETATQIALGQDFGCVLFTDGQVACFGMNGRGQLGRSLSIDVGATDAGLLALTNVRQIAATSLHACAVDTSDALRCWGANESSQLGSGTSDATSPTSVRAGVASVVVGEQHTCVILASNGTIECVGSDGAGQRGNGAAVPASNATWTAVTGLSNVDELVSGNHHVCALDAGVVSCWGENSDGQIGIGTSGTGVNAPMTVIGLTGVDDIDAGAYHTCAVIDGAVYCWGANTSYQSGAASSADLLFATQVPGISDAIAVAAAETHTCVLRSGDAVTCWGSGVNGENGRFSTSAVQTTLSGDYDALATGQRASCGLTITGDVACWGDGNATALSGDSSTPRAIDR